jgi:hypothetical protein
MIFSKSILGTNTNKVKMSWWDYWVIHCWMTGWQSIRNNFITWMDLVWFEDNQKHYTLLKDDIPFEQCYIEFWFGLNDDDVYPKHFLESLLQMVDDIYSGEEKLIPFTKEMFDDLDDLVGDLIGDLKLDEELDDEETT